jgi:hypothetical protein
MSKLIEKSFLSILLIILIWFFYFKKYLLGLTYIPYDSKDQFFLWSSFLVDSLKSFELPLWNPNQLLGEDFIGNPQSLVFSPLFMVFIIVNTFLGTFNFSSIDCIELIHVLLGAIGLFLFLKVSGASNSGSLISSCILMLAGPFASRLQHTPQIVAFSYLPWCLLSSYYLVCHKKLSNVLFFIFTVSSFLVHFNQISYIGIFLITAYILYLKFSDKSNYKNPTNIHSNVLLFLTFLSVFSLIITPLILVLNNILMSSRTKYSYEYVSSNIINPLTYLTFLSPNALFSSSVGNYSGIGDITEQYLYIGHLSIIIILLMFFKLLKNRDCKFWLFASLFFWLCTLGRKTLLYKILFYLLPGFSLFRRPTDFSYFWIFSICIIFSFAFDRFTEMLVNGKEDLKIDMIMKVIIFISIFFIIMPVGLTYFELEKSLPSLSFQNIILDYIRSILAILSLLLFSKLNKKSNKLICI